MKVELLTEIILPRAYDSYKILDKLLKENKFDDEIMFKLVEVKASMFSLSNYVTGEIESKIKDMEEITQLFREEKDDQETV